MTPFSSGDSHQGKTVDVPKNPSDTSSEVKSLGLETKNDSSNFAIAEESRITQSTAAAYLRTLPSIRERCTRVFERAQKGELKYFDYDPAREAETVEFSASIIERDFGKDYGSIPPHGRWNHFSLPSSPSSTTNSCRASSLLSSLAQPPYNFTPTDRAKSLIDLFVVSVLLDAGAGDAWKYTEEGSGVKVGRSEGLALASLEMFKKGLFSGVKEGREKYRVDDAGLLALTVESISAGLQVSNENPMSGLEGRASLLLNLGKVLRDPANGQFFGTEHRPGDMIDYLKSNTREVDGETHLHISVLWEVVLEGFAGIWPTKGRISLGGRTLGDVWPCPTLSITSSPPPVAPEEYTGDGSDLVPFHKLSQWLTYSLVPILQLPVSSGGLGWKVEGMDDMTGLPEYRNGGLFVDFRVLKLKPEVLGGAKMTKVKDAKDPEFQHDVPIFEAGDPIVVEWRAMTVTLLDRLHQQLHARLNLPPGTLNLPQVLEAASWKGGREIAAKKRVGGGPPISIQSDGTVF